MATNITFEYENKAYTLEFTRATAKTLMATGYKDVLERNPLRGMELLTYHAFLANHRNMKTEKAEEIIRSLSGEEEKSLAEVLMSMLAEALEETVLHQSGNVKWQVNK